MIYLDHNATTPLDKRVLDAMLPYLATFYGNPSSLYRAGRVVRSAIEIAREQVAALVGVQATQVIFTSGGTEANNLAIKGFSESSATGNIAVSAIEHPSILDTAEALKIKGWTVDQIQVDKQGLIDWSSLETISNKPLNLVSVMLANNETGAIQPVAELAERLKQQDVIIHTDAVQAVGKMAVDFASLNINLMTLSSHKIYGPKGAGALIIDKAITLEPLVTGGGQESGYRAGTENVAAIIGFGKAAEIALNELDARIEHLARLQKQLELGLNEVAGITIFSQQAERLVNTTQFSIPNTDGEMLLMQLDKKGFAVSSGSACASGGGQPSHVLIAMGIDQPVAKSAIRVSLGQDNTEADVDQFISVLKTVI
jgi:cysteine desulfurase